MNLVGGRMNVIGNEILCLECGYCISLNPSLDANLVLEGHYRVKHEYVLVGYFFATGLNPNGPLFTVYFEDGTEFFKHTNKDTAYILRRK